MVSAIHRILELLQKIIYVPIFNISFLKKGLFNIIQYQRMLTRQIGMSTCTNTRTVGKFYQTQKLTPSSEANKLDGSEASKPQPQPQQMKTRTKSVGHIYNTRSSVSKDLTSKLPSATPSNPITKINYDQLINYNEVENKLSSYLECTIRTNNRQRYNYLSSHYHPKYQSFASTQLRMDHNYGNNRQQNFIRTAEATNEYQPAALRERKSSLGNQINLQITQKKVQITTDKLLKPNSSQKNERKSLKNSRKTESKQKILNNQFSTSKNFNKQNIFPISSASKKQVCLGMASINHQQHKNELQNKLKKLINNYETKNKQLQNQQRKIETKTSKIQSEKKDIMPPSAPGGTQIPQQQQSLAYKNQELKQVLTKLIDFNLKGINLNKDCDEKLEQIWKSIHQQIIADQQLRVIKCFINEANINQIFTILNQNRIKKLEIPLLKTHTDEYDPFLIEKFNEFLKSNNPNLTHKQTCKWICEQFAKFYELSQRNWLKNLSQEKMECTIRTMVLQKEVTSLRKTEGNSKELSIRDFTRYLSTLFKANLRNRNVYQIHNKIKSMSYIGRFIELLEEKAGKGVDTRKTPSSK